VTDARSSGTPVASVVIPTHNRCGRLRLALRSALAQRAVHLEVVIVDDGSVDGTSDMVTGLRDPRVRLVRHDVPSGESGARNRGVAEARGEWVAFLDDDDLWAPDKLARQLQALGETGCDWAYAGDVAIDERLRVRHGSPPPLPGEVMASLWRYNSVPAGASNVIVRAALLARVGPFDTGLRRTADWDMWLRLAASGPPACVRAPLVAICTHGGNMSRDMRRMFRELDVIQARHGIPVDRARHHRWAAWSAWHEGRRWRAASQYGRAALAGDTRSLGRAVVALVRAPDTQATRVSTADPWTTEARAWIEQLRNAE
jgi:glycosyltransferase involved in cell wall biosynthesis